MSEIYSKMIFPNTIEEYFKDYAFIDEEQIYTNGSELIPTFRVKQWEEHKDKEIERLLNIMRPKKADYDYIKLLFDGKSKEEVIKALAYKCEQLENLYKCYEDKEIEARKKDNIINELEKWVKKEKENE